MLVEAHQTVMLSLKHRRHSRGLSDGQDVVPHGQLLESLIAGRKAKDEFRSAPRLAMWWYEIECIARSLLRSPCDHSRASSRQTHRPRPCATRQEHRVAQAQKARPGGPDAVNGHCRPAHATVATTGGREPAAHNYAFTYKLEPVVRRRQLTVCADA